MQREICRKFGMEFDAPGSGQILGASRNLFSGEVRINGLRHPSKDEVSGWYLWLGEEWSDADDFFDPLHIYHLDDVLPVVLPYLALPPGGRFLIAGDYEDVWFDESLLVV